MGTVNGNNYSHAAIPPPLPLVFLVRYVSIIGDTMKDNAQQSI